MEFFSTLAHEGNLRRPDGSSVPVAAALANKEVVALYFSAHWCPPCKKFTPVLSKRVDELKAAGKRFECVFVSSDNSEAEFAAYHGEMSFLAMPFALKATVARALGKKFKVQGIPTLVFLDGETGALITDEGREEITSDAFVANFPYKPAPFNLRALLGDSLRTQQGGAVATSAALADKQVLGIYFSAHWCPPCRGFTPQLCTKVAALRAAGKPVEFVFVSSDRDEAAFSAYSDEMNFPALAFAARDAKAQLSKHFKVEGIPTLVFVDAQTGATINANGRGAISADSFVADFPYHPKAVNDVSDSCDGVNDEPSLVVFLDGAEPEAQVAASEVLHAIAAAELALPAEQRSGVNLFFTVSVEGDRMTSQFRTGAGYVGAAKAATPQMAIFDLGDEGAVYRPAGGASTAVTADNMRALMRAFKERALERGTFGEFGSA